MIAPASTRLIHLVDPPSRFDAGGHDRGSEAALVAFALRTPTEQDRLWVLGGRDGKLAAESMGLSPDRVFAPPAGRAWLCARAIGRDLRPGDRLCGWSHRTAQLASRLGYASSLFGVDSHRWESPAADSLATLRASQDRAAIRQQLGIDDSTCLIAPICDHPGDIDGRRFVFLVALLGITGRKVAGIMSSSTADAHAGLRHHVALGDVIQMFVTDKPVAAFLPACEFAVRGVTPPTLGEQLIADLATSCGCQVIGVQWSKIGPRSAPGLAADMRAMVDHRCAELALESSSSGR